MFALRPIIASFARFPDSFLCFIPLLSSGITRFVVGKSLLMMCNSSLVQFLKKHVSLTMSSHSLICQEGNTCFFKSIMFCSCCLIISFDINTNKYIEIMFFLIFSKSLPCLQLRQGETILGSTIPTEDTDCPHIRNI